MKISSVSKKVLCTALSAATALAFTPAIAFGAIDEGTTVTVKYDVNGGAIADTMIGSIPSDQVTVSNGKLTLTSDYGKLGSNDTALTKNGNNFDFWFVDVDGDGAYDANKGDLQVNASHELATSADGVSGTEVTLKAAYKEPTLSAGIEASSITGSMKASASLSATAGLTDGTQYSAKLTFPDGTTVVQATQAVVASSGAASFTFPALSAAQLKAMTAGKYTFSVSDAAHGVVAEKKVELVTVKLSAGAGYGSFASEAVTTFVVNKGASVAFSDIAKPATSDGSYSFVGYTDGKASTPYASGSITISKDTTLTAVYSNPQVHSASFSKAIYTGGDKGAGSLSFSASNLVAAGETGEYTAVVTGPDGFSKTIELTTDSNKEVTSFASVALTFGADWEGDSAVTAKLAAGTYTVSIELSAKKGKELTAEQKAQKVTAKSATLAAVTYDLGDGQWAEDSKGKRDQPKSLPVLVAEGTSLNDSFKSSLNVINGDAVEANDELKGLDYVTVNGKKLANLTARDTAAASGVTVAVAYKGAYIAAPAVSFAADGSGYKATATAAEGTKVYYSTTGASESFKVFPDDGAITLNPASQDKLWIKAVSTDAKATESKVVEYHSCKEPVSSLGEFATAVANAQTSQSAKNKPVRYGDELTTLKADVVAAAQAKGYATAAEWQTLMVAQARGVLEKAVEVETNNLEALTAPALSEDGKTYTYVSDADAATASEALGQVLADFDGFRAATAEKSYTAKSKKDAETVITDDAADYIAAIAYAVSGAHKTVVSATDADAAKAFDALVTALPEVTDDNYAAAIEAADKAIAAYEALTSAQKALITADPATAYGTKIAGLEKKAAKEAADNAAEQAKLQAQIDELKKALVAEQDNGAAQQVTGITKTVKANKKTKKTKKAVSYTIVAEQSSSGADATFSTVSKTAKVKVNGAKVTLKKGAKKGKTYNAKVQVKYGNATKTVTVKFKVK